MSLPASLDISHYLCGRSTEYDCSACKEYTRHYVIGYKDNKLTLVCKCGEESLIKVKIRGGIQ